mgnify:CR=1 FL=1
MSRLTASNLAKSYKGRAVVEDVSITIESGQIVGLLGPNGAGKTTIMRAIMGLLPLTNGSITFDGQSLDRAKSHLRAEMGIGYLPEDRRLVPQFTVEDNIKVPMWAMNKEDPDRLKWAYELMPEIGRFADRQARRLASRIARAPESSPPIQSASSLRVNRTPTRRELYP